MHKSFTAAPVRTVVRGERALLLPRREAALFASSKIQLTSRAKGKQKRPVLQSLFQKCVELLGEPWKGLRGTRINYAHKEAPPTLLTHMTRMKHAGSWERQKERRAMRGKSRGKKVTSSGRDREWGTHGGRMEQK